MKGWSQHIKELSGIVSSIDTTQVQSILETDNNGDLLTEDGDVFLWKQHRRFMYELQDVIDFNVNWYRHTNCKIKCHIYQEELIKDIHREGGQTYSGDIVVFDIVIGGNGQSNIGAVVMSWY